MKNKRGEVITAVFWYLLGGMFVGSMLLRPQHIVKRSVEKCVSLGEIKQVCEDKVKSWSQDQRIDFIRDKAEGPATQNFHG